MRKHGAGPAVFQNGFTGACSRGRGVFDTCEAGDLPGAVAYFTVKVAAAAEALCELYVACAVTV